MKISVTQEHIDKGQRMDCCLCPIALALQEAGYPDVYVGNPKVVLNHKKYTRESWGPPGQQIFVIDKKDKGVITLSRSAQKFIRDFDKEETVKPFNFILKV